MTLVATSAGAYEGDKMYNIAEEARRQGHGDPPADRRAARPACCTACTSSFHVFVGHPTYRREIAHLPLDEKVAMMQRPEIRAALLAEESAIRNGPMAADADELLYRVFPLGDEPELRAGPRAAASAAWPRRPASRRWR